MKKNYFTILLFILGVFSLNAQIVISEIMYNGPESGVDTSEFIELYNAGSSDVDMTDYYFSEGVTFTFGAVTLKAGEYFVVAESIFELDNIFGAGTADFQWAGSLLNSGETIELIDDINGVVVDMVTYSDTNVWGAEAKGAGSSLYLINTASDNSLAASWDAYDSSYSGVLYNGLTYKGTPGALNSSLTLGIDNAVVNNLKIKSNPTSEYLAVSGLSAKINYVIYNALGAGVLSGSIGANDEINVKRFINGLYLIKFENGKILKFMKN